MFLECRELVRSPARKKIKRKNNKTFGASHNRERRFFKICTLPDFFSLHRRAWPKKKKKEEIERKVLQGSSLFWKQLATLTPSFPNRLFSLCQFFFFMSHFYSIFGKKANRKESLQIEERRVGETSKNEFVLCVVSSKYVQCEKVFLFLFSWIKNKE